MSKNKQREVKTGESISEVVDATKIDVAVAQAEPLIEEVQQFLGKRAELAAKLTQEIEATEKKLVELKKTVALLFPENAPSISKDRKPKKVKSKVASRSEKNDGGESVATPDLD